jgi:hypothetical protein
MPGEEASMRRFVPVVLASVFAMAACSPSTTMLNSWSTPNYQAGSIKKIAVLGVAKNAGVRRTYEDRFVEVLKHMKYDAEQSYHFLPDISPGDTLALHTALEQHGFTHVLCTRLIDQKTVETYIPPTVTSYGYSPMYPGYYGSYGSYYSTGYGYSVDPGYVTHDLVVSLETNLYDVRNPGLIWSGVSQTWVNDSPKANIDSVIEVTIRDLKEKKIL